MAGVLDLLYEGGGQPDVYEHGHVALSRLLISGNALSDTPPGMENEQPEAKRVDQGQEAAAPSSEPVVTAPHERRPGRMRRVFAKADGKFPDPPHPLTLAGPLATLVAVSVAFFALGANRESLETAQRALQVSETNMKVGQRAYLFIENGYVRLVGPEPQTLREDRDSAVFLEYSFDIRNLGRTPAAVPYYSLELAELPGWKMLDVSDNPIAHEASTTEYGVGGIPQGGTLHIGPRAAVIRLGKEGMETYEKRRARLVPPGPCPECGVTVELRGKLTFRDVFGDFNEIAWCWQSTTVSDRETQPRRLDQCEEAWKWKGGPIHPSLFERPPAGR